MMSIFLDALLQLGIPAGVAQVVNEQFAKGGEQCSTPGGAAALVGADAGANGWAAAVGAADC